MEESSKENNSKRLEVFIKQKILESKSKRYKNPVSMEDFLEGIINVIPSQFQKNLISKIESEALEKGKLYTLDFLYSNIVPALPRLNYEFIEDEVDHNDCVRDEIKSLFYYMKLGSVKSNFEKYGLKDPCHEYGYVCTDNTYLIVDGEKIKVEPTHAFINYDEKQKYKPILAEIREDGLYKGGKRIDKNSVVWF